MKVWGIMATILLIASLCFNVWYYSETTNLNVEASHYLEQFNGQHYSGYQLPHETIADLRSNIHDLFSTNEYMIEQALSISRAYDQLEDRIRDVENENQEYQYIIQGLEDENREYQYTLNQIQQEAERAQELEMWESLVRLIFSLP